MRDLTAFNTSNITVKQGQIQFNGFKSLKEEAINLSEEISMVHVTDDNVQISKKILATVNKRVKELEDKRIDIKKEMLEPYTEFEQQVKEIVTIVKNADGIVRSQVKQLEEIERDTKQAKIEELFNKRIVQYDFDDVFKFDDFITPKHLNKSITSKSVETEMVAWLEKKDADLKVIKSLPNTHDILMEYLDTKDLSVAINIVNERNARMDHLEKVVEPTKQAGQGYLITLSDSKDLKMVEMFMDQNHINYDLQSK